MASAQDWELSIVSALRAHFKQAQGPSRPGTDWVVSLRKGDEESQLLVRVYADDVAGSSQEQEIRLVLDYIAGLLRSGWSPDRYRGEPGELTYAPR